ncbi:MAG: alpha-glucosidase [Oscillospiraceae bacterium]|nr:alpha-glucosidase [Oscillospiraceae bacterium]
MSQWWKEAVVYQIYPRSFCDSNGDGIGDIPGIISKLDELRDLGINLLWLSPVYASPNEDNGYDISDYCAIHPDFGTMEDMDRLISEAKARGIRIIMDLVINHTSTEHRWFRESRNPDSPYRNYYFWRKGGKNGKLPNNWTGFFGENCWEYDEKSGEYYLHLFARHQPDLNYYEPKVLEEIKKILRFWLDRGIAGFRCDVINILWKDSLESSPKKLILTGSEHYLSLEGTHRILRELREVFDEYDAYTVGETVFVDTKMACDLCAPERKELNTVFGFEHMECDQVIVKWFKTRHRWGKFMKTLARWQNEVPWNTVYFENHDQPRSVCRFGSEKYREESAKLLGMLLLTLKGTPYIYQGQEIGMTDFDFTSMDRVRDVESINIDNLLKRFKIPKKLRWKIIRRTSRDNARTPMQWNGETGAGFTSGEPWLGINANHSSINLKEQKTKPDSVLNWYKKLIALRKDSEILKWGEFKLLKATDTMAAYQRIYNGEVWTVVLNCCEKAQKCEYKGELVLSNYGKEFSGELSPWEAVILKGE